MRITRLLVALVLAAAVVAGCGSDDGPSAGTESVNGEFVGTRGGRRVVVVGDSITELSRDAIVAALEDRAEVRVDGFSGRRIAGVLPHLADAVATSPDVAVVNLGTNDMLDEHEAFGPDLDRMLGLAGRVPCAVVVTIHDGVHEPVDANIGTAINEHLRAAAATGSIHLVDWNAAVHRDPGLVVDDGIHPNTRGQRWIADAIRDAIRSDC